MAIAGKPVADRRATQKIGRSSTTRESGLPIISAPWLGEKLGIRAVSRCIHWTKLEYQPRKRPKSEQRGAVAS
jgi:hypothetical protein